MATSPLNHGKHTTREEIHARILDLLSKGPVRSLADIGYKAFPDYKFRSPQGAALAVSRSVKQLTDAGLIGWYGGDYGKGYYLIQLKPQKE